MTVSDLPQQGIIWLDGRVSRVTDRGPSLQELEVSYTDGEYLAWNFTDFTGRAVVGDEVVVNVTARALGLGSGGYDFVGFNFTGIFKNQDSRPNSNAMSVFGGREYGHLIKLRYTPIQLRCLSVEEKTGVYRTKMYCSDLDGMPVLAGELHSQVAPAVGGIWSRFEKSKVIPRIVYIMTDGGALPLVLSKTVSFLRKEGLVYASITCGHAFGGDFESVNIHSALVAARRILSADVAVVAIGPGIVGTGTPLGTTAISQGDALNAAAALGGIPIAIPRIGFSDARVRHRGISHHTVTVLKKIVYPQCIVGLPVMDDASLNAIASKVRKSGLYRKHLFVFQDGIPGVTFLKRRGFALESMGRSYDEEPLFFEAAAASGHIAAGLALSRRKLGSRRGPMSSHAPRQQFKKGRRFG